VRRKNFLVVREEGGQGKTHKKEPLFLLFGGRDHYDDLRKNDAL